MAFTRYGNRSIIINDNDSYKETFFDKRDIQKLVQYDTARFYYPTTQERIDMATTPIIWDSSARLYNLANEYYGDPRLWWLIAWFNQKPTEAHYKVGEIVYIPTDILEVLNFFDRSNGDL